MWQIRDETWDETETQMRQSNMHNQSTGDTSLSIISHNCKHIVSYCPTLAPFLLQYSRYFFILQACSTAQGASLLKTRTAHSVRQPSTTQFQRQFGYEWHFSVTTLLFSNLQRKNFFVDAVKVSHSFSPRRETSNVATRLLGRLDVVIIHL